MFDGEYASELGKYFGPLFMWLVGDKAWKYWRARNDNKTSIEKKRLEIDSKDIEELNERLTKITNAYEENEKRHHKERLEAEARHNQETAKYIQKINELETTIREFKITLNLFIASVKEAAEKDPSLSNLIEAIEKNQRQHDE